MIQENTETDQFPRSCAKRRCRSFAWSTWSFSKISISFTSWILTDGKTMSRLKIRHAFIPFPWNDKNVHLKIYLNFFRVEPLSFSSSDSDELYKTRLMLSKSKDQSFSFGFVVLAIKLNFTLWLIIWSLVRTIQPIIDSSINGCRHLSVINDLHNHATTRRTKAYTTIVSCFI